MSSIIEYLFVITLCCVLFPYCKSGEDGDTVSTERPHPLYGTLFPYDISFKEDFHIPDSIIEYSRGELSVDIEYDTLANIADIGISGYIRLYDDRGELIYQYQSWDDDAQKDEIFLQIEQLVIEYFNNHAVFTRNEFPFFMDRYYPVITIKF